jgi:hypothetical protein
MRRRVIFGLLALFIAAGVGCKKRAVDAKASEDANQKALAASQQEKETEALDGIRADIAALRSTAAAQAAEPEFKGDLAVAKRLTSELGKQAAKQSDKEAAATVDRLARSLVALEAAAPANRIQQHLERAEMALTSGSLEEAGGEVLAAAGTAYNPSAPALVPDVLAQLEDASKAVRAGDAAKAEELVLAVMEKTTADLTAADLAAASAIADDAALSIQRKSWPILVAQATGIASLLDGVVKRSAPEAKAETPAAPAPTEEKTATPAPSASEAGGTETKAAAPASTEGPAAGAAKAGETQPQPKATR